MPYSNTRTNAANEARLAGADKIRIYTSGYALQLAEVAITLGTASVSDFVSTLSVTGLPLSGSWSDDGTAAAFRILEDETVIFEGSGFWAVNTTGALLNISNTTAVDGATFNITSVAFTEQAKVVGEL